MKQVYVVVNDSPRPVTPQFSELSNGNVKEILVKADRTATVQNVEIQLYRLFNSGSDVGQQTRVEDTRPVHSTQLLEAFTSLKE